jgi:hypothetical protein
MDRTQKEAGLRCSVCSPLCFFTKKSVEIEAKANGRIRLLFNLDFNFVEVLLLPKSKYEMDLL